MIVITWRGGNNGYGIRLRTIDRDQIFSREWSAVLLQLEGEQEPIRIRISKGFWNKCSELRSVKIRDWLFKKQLVPWVKNHPPRFLLLKVGEANFLLKNL